jgi:antitoxin FitA
MTTVQIKNVPEENHAVLRRQATDAHQSPQEYLRAWLINETSRPTMDEVLARVSERRGGSVPFHESAAAVRDDRDRR